MSSIEAELAPPLHRADGDSGAGGPKGSELPTVWLNGPLSRRNGSGGSGRSGTLGPFSDRRESGSLIVSYAPITLVGSTLG